MAKGYMLIDGERIEVEVSFATADGTPIDMSSDSEPIRLNDSLDKAQEDERVYSLHDCTPSISIPLTSPDLTKNNGLKVKPELFLPPPKGTPEDN